MMKFMVTSPFLVSDSIWRHTFDAKYKVDTSHDEITVSQITDRVLILDYGALKIHNIQRDDAGQYRCVARNSFGLAFSKPVTIEVQGS